MGKLIYSMITSLDGYVADGAGQFDWAEPDEELHRFINEVTAPIGVYLYGRRMYETMLYWETAPTVPDHLDEPDHPYQWARTWQAAEKIVFSTTLDRVTSARTRLERRFDADAIRALKAATASDLSVDGPGLAASALRAGLVDEISQYVAPVVVGGGTPFHPAGLRLGLDLVEERRFGNGVVFLRYTVLPAPPV